ncbi:hypothetical protein [Sulfobacillus thermotolerans]
MDTNSEELREVLDRLVERYAWQPAKSLWILDCKATSRTQKP